jgi:iron complex outermembrane recepter protein
MQNVLLSRFASSPLHLTALLLTLALSTPLPAVAAGSSAGESAPVTSGAADAGQTDLNDVIVTAQRRAESLQDVPISIQAVTDTQLRHLGVLDTTSLGMLVPTLNFVSGNSAAYVSFSLRGVSSVSFVPGAQSSTSLVIDGVPLVRQGEFIAELADIERIEVLNGPQGTLFGKNSTAGVINLVTKKPTAAFEGSVQGGATNDGEYSVKGLLNVPLSDRVRTRFNFFYRDQKGLVPNRSGPDALSQKVWGGEGKVAVQLSDSASVTFSGGYSLREGAPAFVPEAPNYLGAQMIQVLGYTPGGSHPQIAQDTPGRDQTTTYHFGAEINWDITHALSLTSLTSYRYFKQQNDLDLDITPVGINKGVGFSPNPYDYPILYVSIGPDRLLDKSSYLTQETRLNFNSGPFAIVAGGFYQQLSSPIFNTVPFVYKGTYLGLPSSAYYYNAAPVNSVYRDKVGSLFGDVTYQVIPDVKIFSGLRYTHERLDIDYSKAVYLNPVAGFFDPITAINTAPPISTLAFTSQKAVNNLSGRAGAQWQPSDDINFYFTYAHGYKGPGADMSSGVSSPAFITVNPEIADSYEVGAKLRTADKRLSLNVALFNERIKDIQVTTVTGNAVGQTALLNAGNLYTRGVEASVNLAITPEFRLNGGVSYDDAHYGSIDFACNSYQTPGVAPCFQNAHGVAEQNLNGRQSVGFPTWKSSLNARYESALASGVFGNFFIQAGYSWNSSIQYSVDQNPLTREPSHGFLNASAGISTRDGRWDFMLYAENLTDEFYYSNLVDRVKLYGLAGNLNRDFTRYGGLQLTMHF